MRGRWTRRGVIVLAITLTVSTLLWIAVDRDNAGLSDPAITFGVLGSTCAADRVDALDEAGVELAQVDLRWDRLEPVSGQLDRVYAKEVADAIRTCKDAGIGVILGLGLQYAPDWVSLLPDGEYLDQARNVHPGQVPNLVFSSDVRWAFETHAANVLRLLPEGAVHAVRIGTNEAGELGYPGQGGNSSTSGTGYWAFNDAAQTGHGLPADVDKTPFPGWKPGDDTWRGQSITAKQVTTWFDWYSDSVTRTVLWQAETLRSLGFEGQFHIPLAGRGALPVDLRQAIAANLDGSGDRDGSLGRGLYYPHQLQAFGDAKNAGNLIANVTSLDDATAVQARARRPATDSCSPMDHRIDLVTHPDVERWSSSRWTVANARKAGLDVIGENPGSPRAPGTGGNTETDDIREQMKYAPRYAVDCGLTTFLWAFEDDFFGDPRQMTLGEYRKIISTYE